MQRPVSVYDLPALLFERFSTTVHFFVMTQVVLNFINIIQIFNINLLMYLKFETKSYKLF